MQEILSYSFMQNAFLGGILVSILCGVIGTLVIINKMTFIAGGIAHGAYGGIGIAIFFGFSPLLGAGFFSLFLGILVAFIALKDKQRFDAIIGAIWAFGMAIGIVLIDLTPGYNGELMSYLFGSILAINEEILTFALVIDIVFIGFIVICYKQICAVSFDSEFAKLRGVNTTLFYYLIICMLALCIVATIQIVGLLLVIALITIPAYIAQKFSNHIWVMMFISALIATFFCVIGLVLSYYYNITSGASIILVASFAFFIVAGLNKSRFF